MAGLKKRIDPHLVLLVAIIGLWWLLAGGVRTPASEIDALNRTSDPAIWMSALQSPDRALRTYARGHILAACSPDSLREPAIEACSGSDHSAQLAGLWLLKRIDTPGRGEIAARFLDDDRTEARRAALSVLAEDPVPEVHDVLVELTGDPDVSVQQSALAALAALANPDDLPVFMGFLDRSNAGIRETARNAILSLAPNVPEIIPILLHVARGSELTAAREALGLLGDIGGPAALDGLFDSLVSGSPALATDAAEAIGKIGGEEAINRALGAFRSGSSRTRRVAARALGALEAREAAPDLWTAARNENEGFWVRHDSLQALATCGDETLVPEMIDFLEERTQDPRLIRAGIEALGGMDGEQVIALYDAILAGETDFGLNTRGGETAQLSAVVGLGYMHNDASRERLRAFIEDAESIAFLVGAVRSLGKVGTLDDIERLRNAKRGQLILRTPVNEAIAAIEARFPDVEEGSQPPPL